ncbi:hypothetical protein TUM2805_02680 [Escherichia coli]|nr:hypothetical protein ECW26_11420 [Escherichia coli W26]BBG76065.1 hypothetical protein MYEC217_02670 [Escherichia coli]BDP22980.1 hypothetical protein TUM2805_02680 [Escherichia coli]GHK78048.1 hypothetical protein ECZU13_39130 [Escherichia coli]GHK83340.1 hypothetical protein ECZU15_42720 [Escherichia coli]
MLLLQLSLRFQLLIQHPFLLDLLSLHLGLHPLLAGYLIPRLVRVVQSINGLCKADKRQECRKNQKSFHRVSSSEDIL